MRYIYNLPKDRITFDSTFAAGILLGKLEIEKI